MENKSEIIVVKSTEFAQGDLNQAIGVKNRAADTILSVTKAEPRNKNNSVQIVANFSANNPQNQSNEKSDYVVNFAFQQGDAPSNNNIDNKWDFELEKTLNDGGLM